MLLGLLVILISLYVALGITYFLYDCIENNFKGLFLFGIVDGLIALLIMVPLFGGYHAIKDFYSAVAQRT